MRWVPVSEPPEEGAYCVVCGHGDGWGTATWNGEYWTMYDEKYRPECEWVVFPTHWLEMTLPGAPV